MRLLKVAEGNQSKAAQLLGIKRGTLQYKMKTYDIS
jgi:DNA-binding protein Fis